MSTMHKDAALGNEEDAAVLGIYDTPMIMLVQKF